MTDIDTVTTSNAVRLSGRQWLGLGALGAAVYFLLPALWTRIERFETGSDYRIPFALGNDYWLFDRWTRKAAETHDVLVLGDSVVWGHFVGSDQTLTHHLNALSGRERFANLGLDGSHPAALAGLVDYYGSGIRNKTVVLQWNPTWMQSLEQDLRDPELRRERTFPYNHERLIPQFSPSIPCYRENASRRIGHAMDRHLPLAAWTRHLQVAYFRIHNEPKSIPEWTIEHPYENPLSQITLRLGPADDRLEEPIPWTERGIRKTNVPWVDLEGSIQWAQFRRAVHVLRSRGNRLLVVVGPFNEHMLQEKSLERYLALKGAVVNWLRAESVPHMVASVLPSETYADASHPLDRGYQFWARELLGHEFFNGTKTTGSPALPAR